MLLFSTFAAGSLTVYIQEDYMTISEEARAHSADLTPEVHEHYHLAFSLSLSFLVFCGTLTIGLTVLWMLAEIYIWPHEREVQAIRDAAADVGQDREFQFRGDRLGPEGPGWERPVENDTPV